MFCLRYNKVSQGDFKRFSTSEKIKFLIDNDIFIVTDGSWFMNEFFNFDLFINFSVFDNEPFSFWKTYSFNKHYIQLNPLVEHEVRLLLERTISNEFYSELDQIELRLMTILKKKKKIEFLSETVDSCNIFNLKKIRVELNNASRKIEVPPEDFYDIIRLEEFWVLDTIFTEYITPNLYNNSSFYKDYSKDFSKINKVNFCLYLLKELIEDDKNINPKSTDEDLGDISRFPKKTTCYQYAYYFVSIGLVDKLYHDGMNWSDIGKYLAKKVNANHTNMTN